MGAIVTLKKGEGRLLKSGGAWIFDNEVDTIVGSFENGDIVIVKDFDGYPLGKGFINTNSKIFIRMLTRHVDTEIDEAFFTKRLQDAWDYRKKTVDTSSCRVVFGEADFLPGIVIDKFENVLVVESLALGIDKVKNLLRDQYIASINNGTTAGVINGCWIMASITANEDQSGKWAITNMPKLDGVDGATNYSNNGGSSWAISSNCKKQDLAIDFMKSTFAGSTALYDDIIAKGALATWAPAGDSEAYAQPVAFFSDDPVYAKIVDFATKTPSNITGAFYYDARDAVGTALSNIIQTGADMDSELQTAQETVEFNMGG